MSQVLSESSATYLHWRTGTSRSPCDTANALNWAVGTFQLTHGARDRNHHFISRDYISPESHLKSIKLKVFQQSMITERRSYMRWQRWIRIPRWGSTVASWGSADRRRCLGRDYGVRQSVAIGRRNAAAGHVSVAGGVAGGGAGCAAHESLSVSGSDGHSSPPYVSHCVHVRAAALVMVLGRWYGALDVRRIRLKKSKICIENEYIEGKQK